MNLKVSQGLIDNITKHFESIHDGDLSMIGLQPKMDCVGIWTEGYGTAIIDPSTGKFLKGAENKEKAYQLQRIHTEQEADVELLKKYSDIESFVNGLKLNINQNQFDSVCDFCYNCGGGAFQKSSIYKIITGKAEGGIMMDVNNEVMPDMKAKLIQKGYKEISSLHYAFILWCRGTNPDTKKKEIFEGLWRRRESEYDLFIKKI